MEIYFAAKFLLDFLCVKKWSICPLWQWIDFETQAASIDLPECVELCSNEPPFDETIHERTWREGYFGVGEIAKYQCIGKQSKHCETLLNKTTILK